MLRLATFGIDRYSFVESGLLTDWRALQQVVKTFSLLTLMIAV